MRFEEVCMAVRRITVALEVGVYDALVSLTKAQRRTISAQAAMLIEEGLRGPRIEVMTSSGGVGGEPPLDAVGVPAEGLGKVSGDLGRREVNPIPKKGRS
jgi:hypothetical protein